MAGSSCHLPAFSTYDFWIGLAGVPPLLGAQVAVRFIFDLAAFGPADGYRGALHVRAEAFPTEGLYGVQRRIAYITIETNLP